MFHYGRDLMLTYAIDEVILDSREPVQLHDDRYLTLSGSDIMSAGNYPKLTPHVFLWIDLEDGILLGAFYFHPVNGEPTPTLNIFSRQITEKDLGIGQLPPAFIAHLADWQAANHISPVIPRYFIGGINMKFALVHEEEFCNDLSRGVTAETCQQLDSEAADTDLVAANYMKQVNYATNATANMINGASQTAFLSYRLNACGNAVNPVACRTELTRVQVSKVVGRRPPPPPPSHPVRH
jgi:hypothetical protein